MRALTNLTNDLLILKGWKFSGFIP